MTNDALFAPNRVFLRLKAATKPALLAELANRFGLAAGLDPAAVLAALQAREALGSTGVGSGIAVPHARVEGLTTLIGLFARLERPVAFEAIDGKPVDLVVMLLSPVAAGGGAGAHLAALAQVSRVLRNPVSAEAVRGLDDPGAICALLAG